MLQDVYNYGIRHNIKQKPNTTLKQIAGYICIDEDGEFESIEEGVPVKIACPDIGTEKQGLGANAIVDKAATIVPPEDVAKASKAHNAWLSIMRECCDAVPEFEPLKIYLESLENDINVRKKLREALSDHGLIKTNNDGALTGEKLLTFKIEGESVIETGYWETWLADHVKKYTDKQGKAGNGRKMISAITGQSVMISEESKPKVKGGVLGKGATLTVSYDGSFQGRSSFDSYGLERGQNSAIGDAESIVISDTLNFLANKENRHSSNQFGIFYWYSDDTVPDLIGETVYFPTGKKAEQKYEDMIANTPNLTTLYESVLKGVLPEPYPYDTEFKVFKATNAQERYSTREIFSGAYGDLRNGIDKWYRDTEIKIWEKPDKQHWKCSARSIRNIYSLLFGLLDREQTSGGQIEESKVEYGRSMLELLHSVFSGNQIPEVFYHRAIKKGYSCLLLGDKVNPVIIQAIKVYTIREQGGMKIMDDLSVVGKESQAYSCGRLFAVYGKIQQIASNHGQIGNDVCSRYIGMMFKHPDEAFVEMAKLSFAHMRKISETKKKEFTGKIAEITANIGSEFPQKFTKSEQAEFLLGYYRQMNIFAEESAARQQKKQTNNSETENTALN